MDSSYIYESNRIYVNKSVFYGTDTTFLKESFVLSGNDIFFIFWANPIVKYKAAQHYYSSGDNWISEIIPGIPDTFDVKYVGKISVPFATFDSCYSVTAKGFWQNCVWYYAPNVGIIKQNRGIVRELINYKFSAKPNS